MKSTISRRVLLAGFSGSLCVRQARAIEAVVSDKEVKVGDGHVVIRTYRYGLGPVFFAPHADETTGVRAALRVMAEGGGTLVQVLTRLHTRNVAFAINGIRYRVDPNRMFTSAGVEASIKTLSGHYSKDAHGAVASLAQECLAALGTTKDRILALHNNTHGGYSVHSYKKGGEFEKDAEAVCVPDTQNPDDFFLVTTRYWYEYAKNLGYNVVLQSPNAHDDGSLSLYCAQHNIPYINIEAAHGRTDIQERMIRAIV